MERENHRFKGERIGEKYVIRIVFPGSISHLHFLFLHLSFPFLIECSTILQTCILQPERINFSKNMFFFQEVTQALGICMINNTQTKQKLYFFIKPYFLQNYK